jgi:hypothetical protein
VKRTHLSLYYLAGYLLPAGALLLLLLVPEFATKLLLSNRTYDDAPFRLVGILLIGLGIWSSRSFATASRSCTRRPSWSGC